MTNPQTTVTDT